MACEFIINNKQNQYTFEPHRKHFYELKIHK
jgi:hypothetical protein